jgi:hypothetical protein
VDRDEGHLEPADEKKPGVKFRYAGCLPASRSVTLRDYGWSSPALVCGERRASRAPAIAAARGAVARIAPAKTRSACLQSMLPISQAPNGTMRNWPNEPPAEAMPRAMLLRSRERAADDTENNAEAHTAEAKPDEQPSAEVQHQRAGRQGHQRQSNRIQQSGDGDHPAAALFMGPGAEKRLGQPPRSVWTARA